MSRLLLWAGRGGINDSLPHLFGISNKTRSQRLLPFFWKAEHRPGRPQVTPTWFLSKQSTNL